MICTKLSFASAFLSRASQVHWLFVTSLFVLVNICYNSSFLSATHAFVMLFDGQHLLPQESRVMHQHHTSMEYWPRNENQTTNLKFQSPAQLPLHNHVISSCPIFIYNRDNLPHPSYVLWKRTSFIIVHISLDWFLF